MDARGQLVCDSNAEYFKRRHSLNARQTRRYIGNSLTTATEGEKNFLGFMAVKCQVVYLSPVLYVVELRTSTALIGCWDDDVSIVSILVQLISWGRRPQV